MSERTFSLIKHLIWATVLVVLVCLAIVVYGDKEAVEVASGVLIGIGSLIVVGLFFGPVFLS